MCPGDTDVLACVYEGDIWLLTSFNDEPIQVTNTKGNKAERREREGGRKERERKRVNDIYSFLDMYSTPSSEEGDGWTVQFHTTGRV